MKQYQIIKDGKEIDCIDQKARAIKLFNSLKSSFKNTLKMICYNDEDDTEGTLIESLYNDDYGIIT